MVDGRIIKGIGGFYYVETSEGLYECKARGIFRKKKETPLVGDLVEISVVDEYEKKGVIETIKKRKNELIRPSIANVDMAVIVFAAKNPDPNLSLIDRFIVLAEREFLDIVICINKIDVDEEKDYMKIKSIYESCGYKVVLSSTKKDIGIEELKEHMDGNVVVLAGPSGVGKSSLLNAIDERLQLKTGEISEKLGRGKHTTRHAELMDFGAGTMIADTPGFSSLSLNHIDEKELKEYFSEFEEYEEECRFHSDCIHENEPSCAVKNAVENGELFKERYDSYIQLLNEIRNNNRRSRR